MNHIRDHQYIQRGSKILQKLFVKKDTQDNRKKNIYYKDIKKNKERENTMRNKEKRNGEV